MPDFYPYNTSNVPPGGDAGQVLTKESDKSYDVGWHNVGDVNVGDSINKYFESLNGKPDQVLGFDDNGNIKPVDIPDFGGNNGECNCPPIATDEEVKEMLDEVFK